MNIKDHDKCYEMAKEFLESKGLLNSVISYIHTEDGRCYTEYDDVWYDLETKKPVIMDK